LIQDGDWLAIQGSGGGVGEPGLLVKTLGNDFNVKAAPET
jgi:hypothetical protein